MEPTESFTVPNQEKESPKPKHNGKETTANPNPAAHASENGGGTSPEGSKSSEKESSQVGGAGTGGNGGGNPGGGEGAKPATGGGKTGLSAGQKVTGSEAPVGHRSESSSGGGSSPLVPILIAVAVLAAISIGVVLYRQRKSGQGPDRRVSSPNAS